MKIKTENLIGDPLHWAVAKAKGFNMGTYKSSISSGHCYANGVQYCYWQETWDGDVDMSIPCYSEDWVEIGQLIKQEKISVIETKDDHIWIGRVWNDSGLNFIEVSAQSPEVAVARAFVRATLGEEVEIPDDLVQLIKGS